MKTKFLSILLTITLLAALAACGTSGAPGDYPASAGNGASENVPADDTPELPDESQELFNVNATLGETVLVDEDGVKITATGLTYTAHSADLALTIENNSATPTIISANTICNGMFISVYSRANLADVLKLCT